MSSEVIISVEGLGKKYRLRHQGDRPRYTALRDVIAYNATHLFRRNGSAKVALDTSQDSVSRTEEFWALKDVSFEVKQGEVIGIIGRNGAGKSTLLKILSRITEPTEGRITLRGRVASLLEVGTGFHPELTGRENIFLNGAILGMQRAEIKRKFDEIVAFAEVEKFLDTPVKHYSSGMYVRLAFAVAAHLEPEILIVDEVLAVGDAEFQAKCLGKMKDVSTSGRTVLFVSHNLTAVLNLCRKGILLSGGQKSMSGGADQVCAAYAQLWTNSSEPQKSTKFLQRIHLIDKLGQESFAALEGDPLRFSCCIRPPQNRCLISLIVNDQRELPVFELFDNSFNIPFRNGQSVTVQVEAKVPRLLPGHYSVEYWLGDRLSNRLERIAHSFEFDIVPSAKTKSSLKLNGSIRCESVWIIGD